MASSALPSSLVRDARTAAEIRKRRARVGNELRKLAAAVRTQRRARKEDRGDGVDNLIEALRTGISRVSTLR